MVSTQLIKTAEAASQQPTVYSLQPTAPLQQPYSLQIDTHLVTSPLSHFALAP